MMPPLRITLVALLLCTALPQNAEALDVRLEFTPVLTIPVAPFLDSQFVAEPSLGSNIGTLLDFHHGVSGGVQLAVLLNHFEFKYELKALPFSTFRITHIGVIAQDISLFLPAEDFGLSASDTEGDLTDTEPALIHNVGFGWRLVPFDDWVVRPYIPFAMGFSAAQLRNEIDTVFGFFVELGIGAEWDATSSVRVALDVRYTFSAYKNPDTSLSAIQRGASATISTNNSAFDSVLEDLQTVNINFRVSYGL